MATLVYTHLLALLFGPDLDLVADDVRAALLMTDTTADAQDDASTLAPTVRIVVSVLPATSEEGRLETHTAAISVSVAALGADSERRPSRAQLTDEADLLGLGSA